jgi:hypothetical protein
MFELHRAQLSGERKMKRELNTGLSQRHLHPLSRGRRSKSQALQASLNTNFPGADRRDSMAQ